MKTGVDVEITARVKIARALLTNSMLKVLARTCCIVSIRWANSLFGLTCLIDAVNITIGFIGVSKTASRVFLGFEVTKQEYLTNRNQ